MLGSLILYLKGMKIMMFQLSGFYCTGTLIPRPTHEPRIPLAGKDMGLFTSGCVVADHMLQFGSPQFPSYTKVSDRGP